MVRKTASTIIAAMVAMAVVAPAGAASFGGKALKGVAIGYVVKQSAGALDSFINKVTLQRGVAHNLDTKVVPILSVGEKGYVGAVQIAGPWAYVNEVKAVFQYEQNFDNGRYRIKALVPSGSLNPLQLKRIEKVGVTALIDVSLSGGLKNEYYGNGVGASQIIRAAAVAVGVKAVANPLNKFINTITFNKGVATAVVPMASFGEKAYIGGVQISGSARTFDDVKAVWQYEDLFKNGQFRVKILVPSNSINPLKLKRVQGVGITAVIDTSIADQKEANNNSWDDRSRDNRDNRDNRDYRDYRDYRDSRYDDVRKDKKSKDNCKHKGWDARQHDKHDDRD